MKREREDIERRYRALVHAADVMIVGLDADGKITLFNARLSELTGQSADEATGKAFADDFVDEADHKKLAHALATACSRAPRPPRRSRSVSTTKRACAPPRPLALLRRRPRCARQDRSRLRHRRRRHRAARPLAPRRQHRGDERVGAARARPRPRDPKSKLNAAVLELHFARAGHRSLARRRGARADEAAGEHRRERDQTPRASPHRLPRRASPGRALRSASRSSYRASSATCSTSKRRRSPSTTSRRSATSCPTASRARRRREDQTGRL